MELMLFNVQVKFSHHNHLTTIVAVAKTAEAAKKYVSQHIHSYITDDFTICDVTSSEIKDGKVIV